MNIKRFILALAVLSPLALHAQDKIFTPGGFIRGGAYFSTGDYSHHINAAFGDAALTLTAADNKSFTGFADIRLRTGQQFGENVNMVTLREAWAVYYNS